MLVCICNAIPKKDIDAAILSGAKTWLDVHKRLGVQPQCGQCSCEIEEAIKSKAKITQPPKATAKGNRQRQRLEATA